MLSLTENLRSSEKGREELEQTIAHLNSLQETMNEQMKNIIRTNHRLCAQLRYLLSHMDEKEMKGVLKSVPDMELDSLKEANVDKSSDLTASTGVDEITEISLKVYPLQPSFLLRCDIQIN